MLLIFGGIFQVFLKSHLSKEKGKAIRVLTESGFDTHSNLYYL